MAIVLYDLGGAEERCFSPFCWRVRMALAHKELSVERRVVRFTEIKDICDGAVKLVPVIEDDGKRVGESFDIARYLEEAYPDAPSLFGGNPTLAKFVENWTQTVVHAGIVRLVVKDIHDHLTPEDQPYFRASREKRFGQTLEAIHAERDGRVEAFRQSLQPLRATVEANAYLGGETPMFADYLVFGAIQWARVISPFEVLEKDDPVAHWFGRCLDLHDGLGRNAPGYELY